MSSAQPLRDEKDRRLDSWKAIAHYLDRDVRSVQRWERERGLPVHRVPGQKGGAVFAYENELDQWLRSGQPEAERTSIEGIQPAAASSSPSRRMLIYLSAAVLALAALIAMKLSVRSKPASAGANSIAVLPLQNLSGDASQEYFADGFSEELVTDLAQVHSLLVISRTSTIPYKGSHKPLPQIARELGVKYVLEGSVAREGERVRVTAQLINASTDTHLWAKTYEGDVKDVLDIQNQIAREIVGDIQLDLSPQDQDRLATTPVVDPIAHDLYLKASYQYAQQAPESIRQSLALYKQAAEKDPSFAMAYVGIAQAENALLQVTAQSPGISLGNAEQALEKALEINPHLGEARGMLASLAYYRDWDWPRAEREFRIALSEGAGAPTEQRFGTSLVTRGRFEEGMAHIQTALELDPLGKSPRVNQFFALYFQRRYPEARRKLEETLASSPDWFAGHGLLSLVAATQRDCEETERQAQWMNQKFPSPLSYFLLSLASSCRGDQAKAKTLLEQAASYKGPAFISPYQLALGYAYAGDKETALSYLEKSAEIREPQIPYLKVDPLFDQMRSDPRYVAMEQRIGLLP